MGTDYAGVGTAGELAVQRPRGAEPRAAGAAGGQRARPHAPRRCCDAIAVAPPRSRPSGCEVVGVVANRVRADLRRAASRADGASARLRAAGDRPADGADRRPGGGGLRGRDDRRRRRAARARGAAPDGGGDDAAEPDGAHRGRRGADHARRPRRRAAGGAVRARVVGAPLPRGDRADRRAAAAGDVPAAAGGLPDDAAGRS